MAGRCLAPIWRKEGRAIARSQGGILQQDPQPRVDHLDSRYYSGDGGLLSDFVLPVRRPLCQQVIRPLNK